MVSLCKGQGGTPADGDSLRVWGDSWQIVEMAALSGLLPNSFFYDIRLFKIHQIELKIKLFISNNYNNKLFYNINPHFQVWFLPK